MPKENEPLARIKINRLLEDSGWRFEDSDLGPANIALEAGVKYKDLGDDFYIYDEKKSRIFGENGGEQWRIGDRIKIKVKGINIELRQIDYELIKG